MAAQYVQLAKRAAQAAQKYAPVVREKADEMLKLATNGRVTQVSQLANYVGASPQRFAVASGALARSGMNPEDLLPDDLIGQDGQLQQIKATLLATVGAMQNRFDQGSDNTLSDGVEGDIIRRKRVQAALRVYGSEETYYLCHPNGGIPRADFVWYRALFR